MMQIVKYSLLSFLVSFGIGVSSFSAFALTDADCKAQDSSFKLNEIGFCEPTETGLEQGDENAPVATVVMTFMNWILLVFGALAIIAFVIAGIMYLTAAGNENRIDSAKRAMVYSIVGVIVALSGLIILYAVSEWLQGNSMF